jgi:hypothetical protein
VSFTVVLQNYGQSDADGCLGIVPNQGQLAGMDGGAQATVIFSCPKCGAGYQATQDQHQHRCYGSFDCWVCRTEILCWVGQYDYTAWQAVETVVPFRRANE